VFGLFRVALRSFVVGVAVGVLFAPRAGVETRRLLSERIASALNGMLDLGALPPVPADRAHTNGHAEPGTTKKARTNTDARTSS
jgi:gas vesicle protein